PRQRLARHRGRPRPSGQARCPGDGSPLLRRRAPAHRFAGGHRKGDARRRVGGSRGNEYPFAVDTASTIDYTVVDGSEVTNTREVRSRGGSPPQFVCRIPPGPLSVGGSQPASGRGTAYDRASWRRVPGWSDGAPGRSRRWPRRMGGDASNQVSPRRGAGTERSRSGCPGRGEQWGARAHGTDRIEL